MEYKTSDYLPEECPECGSRGFRYRKKEQGWKCMQCGYVIHENERELESKEVKNTNAETKTEKKSVYDDLLAELPKKDYLKEILKESKQRGYIRKSKEHPMIPRVPELDIIEKEAKEEVKERVKKEEEAHKKLKEKVKEKYPKGKDLKKSLVKLAEFHKEQMKKRLEADAKNQIGTETLLNHDKNK